MALRSTTAALPAALVLGALLAACATDEQAGLEQWSGRHFYPQEYCVGVYDGRYDDWPDYWHLRRWCDRREMQGDVFL
ncbi:MAG: hypothetical protein ACFCUQ_17190 [Kiloniellales bacterium]